MKSDIKYLIPLLRGNFVVMSANEINYLRSDTNIVYIMDIHGQQLIGSQTLKFYTDLLSDDLFFLVSQSTLVNLSKIRFVHATQQELELICGTKINMSRNGFKLLKDYIKIVGNKW
jgi:DNA-binding LytR/AlgR family response regulator